MGLVAFLLVEQLSHLPITPTSRISLVLLGNFLSGSCEMLAACYAAKFACEVVTTS